MAIALALVGGLYLAASSPPPPSSSAVSTGARWKRSSPTKSRTWRTVTRS
jgi:hypothetical protein